MENTSNDALRDAYENEMKMRHILYDMCLEDYMGTPALTEKHGKIVIAKKEWENFMRVYDMGISQIALMREIIDEMKPVYLKYRDTYAEDEANGIDFDAYIKMMLSSYTEDDFERVRDMFEEGLYDDVLGKDTDDGIER